MIFLYPPGTTNFENSLGIQLTHAYDDVMIEELNGRYDLSFKYPIDKLESINYTFGDFSILLADSPKGSRQPFFITEVKKGEGYIEVEAKHVFFLLDIFDMGVIECRGSASFALENVKKSVIDRTKFPLSFYSDSSWRVSLKTDKRTSLMDTLCKGKDSLLSQIRGELLRDGYNVGFLNRIGNSTEYILAERKNIEDISIKLDYSKIITRINLELTVDRKKFIPSPIAGSSRVYNKDSVPESERASYFIRLFDGTTGQKVIDNAGAFMLFDANGHFVLSNSQTGTPASVEMWEQKRLDLQKKINEYDFTKSKAQQKKVDDYINKVSVSERELVTNREVYNRTKKESDRLRVSSSERTLRQNKEILEEAKRELQRMQSDLVAWKSELADIPRVVLGERRYQFLLPPGVYYSAMKSAPNGYILNQDVRKIVINGPGTKYDDWSVNPESYDEDQSFRLSTSVYSPISSSYPYVFNAYKELKDSDDKDDKENMAVFDSNTPWVLDEKATEERMREYGQKIFDNDRPDLPLETLSFSLGDEVLESGLGLGDSATVIYENYGLYKNHPLVLIEWSPMGLKYLKMEFGDKAGSYVADLQSQLNSGFDGIKQELENYKDKAFSDFSRKIESEGDRLRSMGIEMLNMATLESYYRTEEVRRGLLDFIEKKGADNVSQMEIEILSSQLYTEELEKKYGSAEQIKGELENLITKNRLDTESKLSEIEKLHNGLKGDFTDFKTLVETDKEKIISSFTDLENENNKRFAQITGDIDGFKTTVSSLDKKVDSNITTLSGKVNIVESSLDSYKSTISSLEETVDSVSGKLLKASSSISELERSSSDLVSRISSAESGLLENSQKISSFSQSVDSLKTLVASNHDKAMSSIVQERDNILLSVSKAEQSAIDKAKVYTDSAIKIGVGNITISAEMINNLGLVKFSDLDGTSNNNTVIDGKFIKTGVIYGNNKYNNNNYWNLETGEFKNSYNNSDVVISSGKIINDGYRYRTTIEEGRIILEDKQSPNDYTQKLILTPNMARVRPYMSQNVYDGVTYASGFGYRPKTYSDSGNIQIISFPVSFSVPSLRHGEWSNDWFSFPQNIAGDTFDVRGVNYIGFTSMNFKECFVAFRSFDVEGGKITRINVSMTPLTPNGTSSKNDMVVTCLIVCNGN